MSDSKIQRLKKHAKNEGHHVDMEMTQRLRDALSDANIDIRVPAELKEELMTVAKKKNIPYQRYIKSILLDAIAKDKAS
jgi:predicted DNA binding CopG/RHH family protein